MARKDKVISWEKRNKDLVSKIEKFYLDYEMAYKKEFKEDEFREHNKMLRLSGRIFNNEIESQVTELAELNENFLAKILD